jgi:hypothetical protein
VTCYEILRAINPNALLIQLSQNFLLMLKKTWGIRNVSEILLWFMHMQHAHISLVYRPDRSHPAIWSFLTNCWGLMPVKTAWYIYTVMHQRSAWLYLMNASIQQIIHATLSCRIWSGPLYYSWCRPREFSRTGYSVSWTDEVSRECRPAQRINIFRNISVGLTQILSHCRAIMNPACRRHCFGHVGIRWAQREASGFRPTISPQSEAGSHVVLPSDRLKFI